MHSVKGAERPQLSGRQGIYDALFPPVVRTKARLPTPRLLALTTRVFESIPTMSMEIQQIELSVEDILNMHKSWISKLFVEDNRSEVEIVQELQEHHLTVSYGSLSNSLTTTDRA